MYIYNYLYIYNYVIMYVYIYTIKGDHDYHPFSPMKNGPFYTVYHHFQTTKPTNILHGNQAVTGIDINLLEDLEGPRATDHRNGNVKTSGVIKHG